VAPAEPFFKKITILGLGLIGGSWALALKRLGYAAPLVGHDRPEVLRKALDAGAIDAAEEALSSAVRDAGLVILAAPVGAILDLLDHLKPHVHPQALVTDVGSTKQLICRRAKEVLGDAPLFLGGHPLAGKETSGFERADPAIFESVYYALTPSHPGLMADARVQAFVGLVESLGARPYVTDASRHDLAVAYLSHVPQLLSSGLASLVGEDSTGRSLPLELAGAGFRDLTRLAESPYGLWRDICLTNIENIRAGLTTLIEKLESIKSHLSDRDLEQIFLQARELRERLREQK
jgi:prephenate dehydrogenase